MVGEVAVIYEYFCQRCKREFEELRSFEDRNNVFCCGFRATKLICSNPQVFNDTKYIMTAPAGYFGKKPVHVSGRKDFKNLLDQHGYADASPKECIDHANYRKKEIVKENAFKRRKVCESAAGKMKKEGLTKHVKGFLKDVVKAKG